MSHQITSRDGLFVVREPTWHGLGEVLPDHPTREQAQKIAHPWEPVSEPIYRQIITADGPMFVELPNDVLNVRDDDGGELAVVSKTFTTVRNSVMYDIAEVIEGQAPGSVLYETGGSLQGGRKVWLMLKLAEPIHVKGDPHGAVLPYYAIQNSHDGTGKFRGQALLDRIVCRNTAIAADMFAQAQGTEFEFNHTLNIDQRIEEAKAVLAGWRASVTRFNEVADDLNLIKISPEGREVFVTEFVPMPAGNVISERVRGNIEDARTMIRRILAGVTCEGIDNTAWGLVQAAIEYSQHVRKAQTRETRFKRAYLDRSQITVDAVDLARSVASL